MKRKIALIINAHAKKARRNPVLIQKMMDAFPNHDSIWKLDNFSDLSQVTRKILDENYEIVFLSGGDGTFRATVESFLSHKSTKSLPLFLLLQGGTGCLYSKHYYGSRNPLEHLQSTLQKLEQTDELPTTPINILNVNGRYGFIFSVGGFSNILSYYMGHKERSIALANWIIFKASLSYLFGTSLYKKMFPTFQATLIIDGLSEETQMTNITCSSLPVGYILSPFYGMEVGRNFSGIIFHRSPYRIFQHVSAISQKKPFRSKNVRQFISTSMQIILNQPLQPMVDGDMLEPATEINIKLGPKIDLLIL